MADIENGVGGESMAEKHPEVTKCKAIMLTSRF